MNTEDEGQENHRPRSASCESIKTVTCRNLDLESDLLVYGYWHESSCRQFLIDGIQQSSSAHIQNLIDSPQHLRSHLLRQLEQQADSMDGLTSLSLACKVEAVDTAPGRNNIVETASTTSLSSNSSKGSIASQVSDSEYNDVQQSSFQILHILRVEKKKLFKLEKKKSLTSWVSRRKVLKGDAKKLLDAMDALAQVLKVALPDMGSIGFTDIGLRLNKHGQDLNNIISKTLASHKTFQSGERLKNMTAVLDKKLQKLLLNQKRTSDKKLPLDKSKARRKSGWPQMLKPSSSDDYCLVYQAIIEKLDLTVADTELELNHGFRVRNEYLTAACSVLNALVLLVAMEKGIRVDDKYEGRILVGRTFKHVSAKALSAAISKLSVLK